MMMRRACGTGLRRLLSMSHIWSVLLFGSVVGLGPGCLSAQSEYEVAMRAIRFYTPGSGQTQVTAFVRIPYGALQTSMGEDGERLRFTLSLRVADDSGRTLYAQQWAKRVPPPAPGGENGLDMIRFGLNGGRYLLEALVRDSISGAETKTTIPLEGYHRAPIVSDLLLSKQIREAARADTMPKAGEVRRGRMLLTASAAVTATTDEPRLSYLFETYLQSEVEGKVEIWILDATGEVLRDAAGHQMVVSRGTAALTGELDLTGIPPGRYGVLAHVLLGKRRFIRQAPFVIVPPKMILGTTLDR